MLLFRSKVILQSACRIGKYCRNEHLNKVSISGNNKTRILSICKYSTQGHGQQRAEVNHGEEHRVEVEDFIGTNYADVDDIVTEVLQGSGYFILPQLFSKTDIEHGRKVIHSLIQKEGTKATHFQGREGDKPELQARTWNLLAKGKIFEKMVQHPKVVKIMEKILGDDFQLGSIAGNTLRSGASGQEPHIDYPYWDYFNKSHWPHPPKVASIPFVMNMQATILFDDFTTTNGATGVLPYTQLTCEYPNVEGFYENCKQLTGSAGDVIIFCGLIHHAAMPHKGAPGSESRTGILLQYLPKYIRPMEDIKRAIHPDILARATPTLQKMLLLDYPYPAILDDAEAVNSEGSKSEFEWK